MAITSLNETAKFYISRTRPDVLFVSSFPDEFLPFPSFSVTTARASYVSFIQTSWRLEELKRKKEYPSIVRSLKEWHDRYDRMPRVYFSLRYFLQPQIWKGSSSRGYTLRICSLIKLASADVIRSSYNREAELNLALDRPVKMLVGIRPIFEQLHAHL